TAENFHKWRKHAKDLWYDMQLLEPVWPEQMCAAAEQLEKLTDFLGDDHDLHMLRQTAVKKSVHVDLEEDAQKLLPLIDSRQKELRNAALKIANGFFHDKPSIFCERLHSYWSRWKSKANKAEEKRVSRSSKARTGPVTAKV